MTLDPKLQDVHVLALTLYGQCRSGTLEDMLALGCLLRNQVRNGASYRSVCCTESCWDPTVSQGNHDKLEALMRGLLSGTVTDAKYQEAAWVAIGLLNGWCRDLVQGATASHPVTELPRPDWAQRLIPTCTYARRIYYTPAQKATAA